MADVWDLIKVEVLSSMLSCGSAEGEAAAGRSMRLCCRWRLSPRSSPFQELAERSSCNQTLALCSPIAVCSCRSGESGSTAKPGSRDAANPKKLAIIFIIFTF